MKTALSLLAAPVLASVLAAAPSGQKGKPAKKDHGTLTLGSVAYRYVPESLSVSQAGKTQPMTLFLRGRLLPVKGGKPLAFSFTLYRPGPLGGMMLGPRTGKGDTWIATLQSHIDAAYPPVPKEGDEAVFTFTGPLIQQTPKGAVQTTWQGEIHAPFTSVP
ncbi:MAG TPA: hypothetical protein VFT46_10785 [Holophagaceae bacterium]|nr:hypothetical protein [Holophagaceae bacterium]